MFVCVNFIYGVPGDGDEPDNSACFNKITRKLANEAKRGREGRKGGRDLERAKGVRAHFEVGGGGGGSDIAKPDIIGENIPLKAADSPKLRAASQIETTTTSEPSFPPFYLSSALRNFDLEPESPFASADR